ncbi:MAG TPA: hypothetical protein VKY26_07545 [Actinomycetota bacterium]|nr:hypothetical protein [Actinomycetota bacterium]
MTLRAATVTSSLPATIEHDPTGLFTGTPGTAPSLPGAPTSVPTPSPTPPLRMLTPADNGTTITVPVGAVLLTPFGANPGSPAHAASSDPAVLGPLGSPPPVGPEEFRAWKPGSALLTIAGSCSKGITANPSCAPFSLHVVVQ